MRCRVCASKSYASIWEGDGEGGAITLSPDGEGRGFRSALQEYAGRVFPVARAARVSYIARMKCGFQVATLGLAVLWLAGCGPGDTSRAPARGDTAARPVRIVPAAVRPMERALPVVGTLRAQDDAIIAAQVAGQIETTRVDLGDRVTAGQELALIDTASYEALARQSAANLARVQAAAANAAQNLKRIQELRRDNIASTSELDLAVAESDQARAEVKSVEAADAVARLNLDRSRVRAPFDGVVAERILSAGAYAAIGTPIVRLVKADPLRLRLEVPEREAPAVRAGQTVRVTVEGDTNVYTGQLTRIAPALQEANRMLTVEADVPAQGGLRPGLFVRAHIVVNESEPAVSVPADALTTFAGLEKIITVKDGKAVERAVTTGRRGADWVEIVSGLAAGEPVVLDPAGLRMGQPVTTNLAEAEARTAGEAGEAAR